MLTIITLPCMHDSSSSPHLARTLSSFSCLRPLQCINDFASPVLEWTLQWRHNGCDGVSNHRHHDCLLNRLFRRRSKKTSKLRVTGLCAGNSPVTGEFPAQMASNAENVSIWWRHHGMCVCFQPKKLRTMYYEHSSQYIEMHGRTRLKFPGDMFCL